VSDQTPPLGRDLDGAEALEGIKAVDGTEAVEVTEAVDGVSGVDDPSAGEGEGVLTMHRWRPLSW
jgi:hypothetical protein